MSHEVVDELAHEILLLGLLPQAELHELGVRCHLNLELWKFDRWSCRERRMEDVHMVAQDADKVGLVDDIQVVLLCRFRNVLNGLANVFVQVVVDGVQKRRVGE